MAITITRSLRALALTLSLLGALLVSLFAPFSPVSGMLMPVLAAGMVRYVNSTLGMDSNDCTNPLTPCRTIQQAINESSDGDGIQIENNGPYSETLLITPSVVISGAASFLGVGAIPAGSGPTVVDPSLAGLAGSVATITAMTATVGLYDLILRNGHASSSGTGGGIDNGRGGTVSLTDTTVQSNTAAEGGGIYNGSGGTLTLTSSNMNGPLSLGAPLTGSNVLSNTATMTDGGGIYNLGTLTAMSGTAVANNTAHGEGGGIYGGSGSTVSISGSAVISNSAGSNGGGLYGGSGSTVMLSGSPVVSNTAGGFGGGIDGDSGSTVTLSDSPVVSNTTTGGFGGGIAGVGTVMLSGSPVLRNTATRGFGGGIDGVGTVTLSGSPVMSNSAGTGSGDYGGGIDGVGTVTLSDSPVANNTAGGFGGGIDGGSGSTVSISGSAVISNSAGSNGGGIYGGSGSTVMLSDSAVLSNTASSFGGGIDGVGTVTLSDSAVLSNAAGGDGGGIYGSMVTLSDSPVQGNTAAIGGGIYGFGTVTLSGSQVVSNTASNYGGGIFGDAGSTVALSGSAVLSNTAADDGGGVEAVNAVTVLTSTLRGNSAGGRGGALASGYSAGAVIVPGRGRVQGSTIADNSAAEGGGIANITGTLALTNSTLAGNSATSATLGSGGAITNSGALTLTNTTLARNSAVLLGGALANSGAATLTNTLLVTNTDLAGTESNSCAGTPPSDGGHNLEHPSNSCGFTTAAPYDDQFGDPLLAALLADNGGPTPTLAVNPAGTAYAHGDGAVCRQTGPDAVDGVDQRGFARPTSGPCAIGAFEPQRTTLHLTGAPNPSVVGQSVTLTATVAASPTEASPVTGTVTFSATDAGGLVTPLGSAMTMSGTAAITTAFSSVGAYTVTATYTGTDTVSSTATLSQTVDRAGSTTTLVSAPNPSLVGQRVDLTATVAISAPAVVTPTGVVTFTDGTTPLGSAPLVSGTASYSTTALSAGPHMLTATYGGDANVNGSSGTTTQQVNAPTATPTATAIPPTRTSTPLPPTQTGTLVAMATRTSTSTPTRTGTPAPTMTGTTVPPTATHTAVPPSATPTPTTTAVPPSATPTTTAVPPSATPTTTAVPPSATPTTTAVPPTSTPTTVSVGVSAATATATRVPVTPPHLTARAYLAGGVEAATEHAYLALLNPTGGRATVRLTFYFASGTVRTLTLVVAARTQQLRAVAGLLGPRPRGNFGLVVASDRAIAARLNLARPGKDGDTIPGSAGLNRTWYLAEGYTNLTFHETLALLNTSGRPLTVTLHLLPASGHHRRTVQRTVGAHRERLVNLNSIVNRKPTRGGEALSVVATAPELFLLERTLTFGQQGDGLTTRDGSPLASTHWFFAEGSTLQPYQTFLTILNPGLAAATVTVRFYGSGGQRLAQHTLTVAPRRRATLFLNHLGALSGRRFASVVTSDQAIVVERPEYRGSPNGSNVTGSDVVGRTQLATRWAFPGADTAGATETLLVYNPNGQAVRLAITAYPNAGLPAVQRTVSVPARARGTLNMHALFPQLSASHGLVVRALANSHGVQPGVIVEQTIVGPLGRTLVSTQGIPTP